MTAGQTAAQIIATWQRLGAERVTITAGFPCGHTFADPIKAVAEGETISVLLSCCACARLYIGSSATVPTVTVEVES